MELTDKKGITGFTLKMIAVVTMFIDHFAATIVQYVMLNCTLWVTPENQQLWWNIYEFLRGVGRMAFPIYCFLIVEGLTYTRNKWKYALRLGIFALISEIPFDMAFNYSLLEFESNNVFFTLLLGLLTIICIDSIMQLVKKAYDNKYYMVLFPLGCLMCAVVGAGMLLAEYVFKCDYGAAGIIAIAVLYFLRNHRMVGFGAACVFLGLMSSELEFAALLMLIPMYFYNGKRGRQAKYFFYAFYPVHLLILALVGVAIGKYMEWGVVWVYSLW